MNLSEAIKAPDTVLFVGSGASAWSGLPSWGKLLSLLAEYLDRHGMGSELLRSELNHGDLLQAASYGFDKLTKYQQGDFIRSACLYGVARPSPLHQLLVTLGPRCFITTNYDNLIEEALRIWQPNNFFPPPVTNRNLAGMPEIVQARAVDFIFKPHGDAADGESIVLTREHYRMLLPGGERQAALESLKMLLVSRPIIYVGFGLRDPDFLYLKDVLLNIYKGGTRDHFALMADVSREQCDYWRRTYGIHLIPYETTLKSDNTRDHGSLLAQLRIAANASVMESVLSGRNVELNPGTILALARYSSGLSRTQKITPEFVIRVGVKRAKNSTKLHDRGSFQGATVEKLLCCTEKSVVLLGLPGAGKSYALRKNSAFWAEKLHADCLQEKLDPRSLVVPVFADLKLYQGSLVQLINSSLPAGLDFGVLRQTFSLRIYFDSFNEVPRKFVESGELEADVRKFIETVNSGVVIIGSRTLDGLDGFGLDAYSLEAIEESAVIEELRERGVSLDGRFESEMTSLLQRPFFFRYVLSGEVALFSDPSPKEFYRLLLCGVEQRLAANFSSSFDLFGILRPIAYQALDSGEETFSLNLLLSSIEARVLKEVPAINIVNWLISNSILVPYSGGRIAFVHQSITEYLASLELADQFSSFPGLLREKLGLRRWDQALFLSLGHLLPPLNKQFFNGVLDVDLGLALAAIKFVETDRDKLAGELLDELILRRNDIDPHDFSINSAMEDGFPLSMLHIPQLQQMVSTSHPLKGAAARCVIEILGDDIKSEYLSLLVQHKSDFNFCAHSIGAALAPFAVESDVSLIAQWVQQFEMDIYEEYDEDDFFGFVAGVAEFASSLPMEVLQRHLLPASSEELKVSPIRIDILRNVIRDRQNTEGLQCACRLLELGDVEASVSLYFVLRFAKPEDGLDLSFINSSHVEILLKDYSKHSSDEKTWSWDTIYEICNCRPDFCRQVESFGDDLPAIKRAGLLMCARQDQAPVLAVLRALLDNHEAMLICEKFYVDVGRWDIDWTGEDKLFLDLLLLKNNSIAGALLGGSVPVHVKGLGRFEILNPDWWLDWISELVGARDYWMPAKICSFLSQHATDSLVQSLKSEVNDPKSRYRSLLVSTVLVHFSSITTDELSIEARALAIEDMLNGGAVHFHGSFIGGAATELFATEQLVPLLALHNGGKARRIREVLKGVGERHGIRYF